MNLKVSFMLVLITILIVLTSSISQKYPPPTKLGLLTATHQRNPNNQYFKKYLRRYAEMECDIISEISIVWNNQYPVETSGVLQQKTKWKHPVYFHQSKEDTLAYRFYLPKESTAEIFFVLDDDIQIGCEQLKHGFQIWRQHAVGTVGPLTGYVWRSTMFNSETGIFNYHPFPKPEYVYMLVGATFINREFMMLYNSQNKEAEFMQQQSLKKHNCDDLMMNFLVGKYYPYFRPVFIKPLKDDKGNSLFKMQTGPNAVSSKGTHFAIRNQCQQIFAQKMGMIPLHVHSHPQQVWKQKLQVLPKQLKQDMIHNAAQQVKKKYFGQSTLTIQNNKEN